jgi:glycosyltransferase involved in cell wall biosynthesis
MEAAAMSKASVVTDIRGCRQTVDDKTTGLIVPLRDQRALVDALEWMIEHPEERARMGAAARAKALREFDETRIIEAIIAAYHDLTANMSGGFRARARRLFGSMR